MGLSDREYMRSPEEPAISSSTVGIFALVLLAAIFVWPLISAPRPKKMSSLKQQLESQIIAADPKYKRHERLAEISPIDVNVASYNELMLLPISDKLVAAIIAGRPFFTVDQLDDVYGIGVKTLDLIRPDVCINLETLKQNYPDATPPESELGQSAGE